MLLKNDENVTKLVVQITFLVGLVLISWSFQLQGASVRNPRSQQSQPQYSLVQDSPTHRLSFQIGVRNAHGMVYDSHRQRVILFGGADAAKVCSDTWEWDGRRWTLVSVHGPGPRTFPAMAYDSVRRRVVMFGGNRVLFGRTPQDNKYLDDTWEWDGRKWTEIKVSGPPPRAEAVMVFDSQRGRTVLFGGHSRSEQRRNWLGDTWEWDGKSWIQIDVPGPSPRNGAAAAYDSLRKRVVLFGGSTEHGVSGETWEWNGREWSENQAANTEGRFNSVMAFDAVRARMVRFGGRFGGKAYGDTWEYDGKEWKRLTTTGPTARNHSAMVYVANRKRVFLFGGHDLENVFGDGWLWDGKNWKLIERVDSQKRVENGH